MKKFLFLAAALLALGISTACADSDRPIDVAQLPQKAQQFIQKHFAGEKVALAKVERDFLEVRYEWKEVDCRYSSVPAAVVPAQIAQYVSGHYPDASIVQIDRDKHDYEVKLSNGLELTFDLKFNLIDIDD